MVEGSYVAVTKYPKPAGLDVYCRLIDVVAEADLISELGWNKSGWFFYISKNIDSDPLVTVQVRERFPACLNTLAVHAAAKLSKL